MKDSFLHKTYPKIPNSWLYLNPEVDSTNSSAPVWNSLPKKVWTIWLTGYESAPITSKVAYAIMKKRFESKGFSVHLIDLKNAADYLGKATMV